MDREHLLIKPCCLDVTPVLARWDPEISRPDLDAKLLRQKDGRPRPTTTQVQHPHARLQVQSLAQPLRHPERMAAHPAVLDPPRHVLLGAGKSLAYLMRIHLLSPS